MTGFPDWSTTAANNSSIGFEEGMLPGDVNNDDRLIMSHARKWGDDISGKNSTAGSSNTYTLTSSTTLTAYADGTRFSVVCNGSNTGASTLNVDSVGAKAIKKFTAAGESALAAGDLITSGHYDLQYDASAASAAGAWILLNPSNAPDVLFDPTFTLGASVGSNALTITVNPTRLLFRNATAGTGDQTNCHVGTASTLVINSTATMGFTSAKAGRLWVTGHDDAGTFRVGAINCFNGIGTVYPLRDYMLASSTAVGTGADSAGVIYTGSAVTTKALRIIGFMEWSSGLTTAGTWDAVPTKIQIFGPGVSPPGTLIQNPRNVDSAFNSGTTVLPFDNTTPQKTEGDEYMTQAITPTSAANMLRIHHHGYYSGNMLSAALPAALFQDAAADALAVAITGRESGAGGSGTVDLIHYMRAATTSSTTFKIRAGSASAGTTSFNGIGSAAFNGLITSFLEVQEIMA